MNSNTYRLVFSKRLGIAMLVAQAFAPASSFADNLPAGNRIVGGNGTISQTGNTLTFDQKSHLLSLEHGSYNIGKGYRVHYEQISTDIAISRVIGNSRSEIYGSLTSGGQVFLINPNGVLFGKTAEVNVGSLVASTKNFKDDDIASGTLNFSGNGQSAGVVNQGNLSVAPGGYIVLAGDQVSNEGTISAQAGKVVLAAGGSLALALDNGNLLSVKVNESTLNALLENKGLIVADGGSVVLTALGKGMLQNNIINNTGTILARSLGMRNGSIVLNGGDTGAVVSSGTIDASGLKAGEKGGSVTMQGQYVGVLDHGRIDARGDAGGGTVLVGGDYQGKNPDVRNAAVTVVSKDAMIEASAVASGDGGKVVLWSDVYTGFYGKIVARGGAQGGAGGFVETSSHNNLQALGSVDAGAAKGLAGQWLLDPSDIHIVAGAVDTATNNSDVWSTAAASGNVSKTSIETALNNSTGTTNVTIQTSGGSGGNGDIFVDTDILKTAGGDASLSLLAYRDIVLKNVTIESQAGKLNVNLNAGVNSGAGTVWIGEGITGQTALLTSIITNGGNLVINGDASNTQYGQGVMAFNSLLDTGAGNMSITGTAGAHNTGTSYSMYWSNVGASGVVLGYNTIDVGGNLTINGTASADNPGYTSTPVMVDGRLVYVQTSVSNRTYGAYFERDTITVGGTTDIHGDSLWDHGVTFLESQLTSGGNATMTANSGGISAGLGAVLNFNGAINTIAGHTNSYDGVTNDGLEIVPALTLRTAANSVTNISGTSNASGLSSGVHISSRPGAGSISITGGTTNIAGNSAAGVGVFIMGDATNPVVLDTGVKVTGTSTTGTGAVIGTPVASGGGYVLGGAVNVTNLNLTGISDSGTGVEQNGSTASVGTSTITGTSGSGTGVDVKAGATVTSVGGTISIIADSRSGDGLKLSGTLTGVTVQDQVQDRETEDVRTIVNAVLAFNGTTDSINSPPVAAVGSGGEDEDVTVAGLSNLTAAPGVVQQIRQ